MRSFLKEQTSSEGPGLHEIYNLLTILYYFPWDVHQSHSLHGSNFNFILSFILFSQDIYSKVAFLYYEFVY